MSPAVRFTRRSYRKARNYLSRKLNTRTVAVNNLRFEYGFGFNTLYHPFVEAIRCGQHDTAYRHLVRFYEFMLPYVYTFEEREEVVPVQAWKWGKQRFARYLNESDPFTYNFLCSDSLIPEKADKEARKLLKLVDSIARHGYDPRRYNAEPIRGVEINGRVLLLGGQHRAVALAVLGHPALKVEVRDHQNTPGRCDAAEVERLPLVASGLISPAAARRVLNRISDGFTTATATSYGLLGRTDFETNHLIEPVRTFKRRPAA